MVPRFLLGGFIELQMVFFLFFFSFFLSQPIKLRNKYKPVQLELLPVIVGLCLSMNLSCTNRRAKQLFPTAILPIIDIFNFRLFKYLKSSGRETSCLVMVDFHIVDTARI